MRGEASQSKGRWLRSRNGEDVYRDDEQHVAVILRALGISEQEWSTTLDRYADLVGAGADAELRLTALGQAFLASTPQTECPAGEAKRCVACGGMSVRPAVARHGLDEAAPLVYGSCSLCHHGQLLSGAAAASIYESNEYYEKRSPHGIGYQSYLTERPYRESKGERLLDWIERTVGRVAGERTFLEVGSGFGFTRKAAADRGFVTTGVDLNPRAAEVAREIYGWETFAGSLEAALASGAIRPHSYGLVLYQFVLEHVAEPGAELCNAARALAPGGHLALVVPSMTTYEIELFGSRYRSLRADHLHLYSIESARSYLLRAGLELSAFKSECGIQMLSGFLEPEAIELLHAAGRGPDLVILAGKKS